MDDESDMSDHEIYGEQVGLNTPLLDESGPGSKQDANFAHMIASVEQAIAEDILPEMILQGSSGSYFCRNTSNEIVGVFKPKNEEPYGHLNPKWGKWIQKHFCCWCYGRDCLPQNQGYLSEAGASLVDQALGLNIVPKTKVVRLVSSSFHYSRFDRARARAVQSASRRFPETVGKHLRQGLPPKIGSFQVFVRGFKDASEVLRSLNFDELQPETQDSLTRQFQHMVVLDYLTRNTDRGNDNWLLRFTPADEDGNGESIQLAAIDNGLSFPKKHPDNWRAYPYYWAWLYLARFRFRDDIVEKLLPQLRDETFIEGLCERLYLLFKQDYGFSRSVFEKKKALNLTKALEQRLSPAELVRLPPITVELSRRRRRGSSTSSEGASRYTQVVADRRPFFQWI
ncbi:phosphatidylinositol kinase [Salpingoeca rosetta]|uniref:1-phosphatidylinositol 4-kinase n=1 Tax=Salpingoeca rosetta (strain ATCC 50818 / BSB-021) TaxID=946362 RepID=F2UMG5_SALR5|nr:phosphatidylinositol kinase [Salpingoeca rosetta]EGD78314.1 phosphatidylinositol kinase [Salpingoeca rosetta]|eukprot:XP_004989637.1 phosphatidylinositol kinase [Salpingoeca rosetta]